LASKIRMKKKDPNFVDFYLKLDEEKSFTKRKFSELQKLNQRKKRLKQKIIKKKLKKNHAWYFNHLFYENFRE